MLFFDEIMQFIPTFREEIMLRKIFLPYFDRHNYNFMGLSWKFPLSFILL